MGRGWAARGRETMRNDEDCREPNTQLGEEISAIHALCRAPVALTTDQKVGGSSPSGRAAEIPCAARDFAY